jgi:hypothetical protein
MEDQKEHVLAESDTPDVVMEDDFDINHFLGAMGRKSKRPLTDRRRIEELREERHLRAAIRNSWED